MIEYLKRHATIVLLMAALLILTPILTVITRELALPFDPVLILWSVIFFLFALKKFESATSGFILAGPLFIAALLPMLGAEGIRDNPNNQNLLDVNYYYITAAYLIAALTFYSNQKRKP